MLKWEKTHSGYYQLLEIGDKLPNGNLVWATIIEMETSSEARFQKELPRRFNYNGPPRKTFSWGGPLVFFSARWSRVKREHALKKAKKWCEEVYKEYWDILSMG